ncbi:LysR family transcriptional regulator [Rhizobium sp. Root274]|uniref:LysR family transcriptional regulator n=1 Tax=unclassified Rhizobium TaxID=2613769 RepID=UPI000712C7C0|nr:MULTISPECIES: LysR family transcriptional regulator [unclassified Rhizobium]KQW31692.1 LysR family transcriptional regulator [Rhizobium sp. Root1240]KRD33232.1 LysR family transcriptional regulator [Rhizobium sp. Root274]
MKDIAWDAYQLFIVIARQGGLTAAADVTGLSPATLGRRMVELEQRLGRELFLRSQTGYRLTSDGGQLLKHLSELEAASRKVEEWRRGTGGQALVRISLGTWIAWLVAQNMHAIRTDRDAFRIDMNVAEQRARLAHRESDIGIRAFEPEEPNLASVAAGEVAYATYRASNRDWIGAEPWLAVDTENAVSNYLRWPHENKPDRIVVTVNRPRSLRDLVRAGAGMAILPCFVGDLDPTLERVGEEIAALRHRQWIVMNNDDRHRREIRMVVDRMAKLLAAHKDLLAGRRPSKTA